MDIVVNYVGAYVLLTSVVEGMIHLSLSHRWCADWFVCCITCVWYIATFL